MYFLFIKLVELILTGVLPKQLIPIKQNKFFVLSTLTIPSKGVSKEMKYRFKPIVIIIA